MHVLRVVTIGSSGTDKAGKFAELLQYAARWHLRSGATSGRLIRGRDRLSLHHRVARNDSHHLRAHMSRAAFFLDIIAVRYCAAERTRGVTGFRERGRVEAETISE